MLRPCGGGAAMCHPGIDYLGVWAMVGGAYTIYDYALSPLAAAMWLGGAVYVGVGVRRLSFVLRFGGIWSPRCVLVDGWVVLRCVLYGNIWYASRCNLSVHINRVHRVAASVPGVFVFLAYVCWA